ncbi:MAG TPA: VOC family protein [Mycobacteriales bacterium]|nr:VOC family protein [Mycobacteriales bacterium]
MPRYDWNLVFDCHDPHALAEFWLTALAGYDFPGSDPDGPVGSPPPGFATWEAWADSMGYPAEGRNLARTIIDTTGRRPDIFFLAVPEGKVAKNRLHLDVKVSKGLPAEQVRERQDTEAARLVAAGAAIQERIDDADGSSHLILADPEGNEFCVI